MIKADTHLHTCYSHGVHTPWEMYISAQNKGLELIGFSEHSPRPDKFSYTHEYREQLTRFLPRYVEEVLALKENAKKDAQACKVLLGLEMDWMEGEGEFIGNSIAAHPYDYIIGSVHFIGTWGFDDGREPWENASQEECEKRYAHYFNNWHDMLASGMFHIAAHPDLIKIYSVGQFHIWLDKAESKKLVKQCLLALRDSGMAMEISSAGLRKACKEIYPAPAIMDMAAELGLDISLASDAHCMGDIARDFDKLAEYAKSFGFSEQTIFDNGKKIKLPV